MLPNHRRRQVVSALLLFSVAHWVSVAGAFEVSVSGYAERSEQHRAYGGWLAVQIPFDRWFSPLAPALSAGAEPLDAQLDFPEQNLLGFVSGDEAAEAVELEQLSEPPSAETAGDSADAPAEPKASAATLPAPSPPTVESWHLSTAQLHGLVRATLLLQAQRLLRVAGLADRARYSAWLPELKVRAGRNSDQTLRLTPTTEEPDRWALTGGSGLRFEGELRWQFDRLVFASEEVSIERLRFVLEQQRERSLTELLQWVFRWQLAVLRSHDIAEDPAARLSAALQAEQAAAALDVLSGGWFGAHVPFANTPASER